MFGLNKKKQQVNDAPDPQDDALAHAAEVLDASVGESPAKEPAREGIVSEDEWDEKEEETENLQAKYHDLRAETEKMINEPHPEVIRNDTVVATHDRQANSPDTSHK